MGAIEEFTNSERRRYYGKRIGDVVKLKYITDRAVVTDYCPGDNNRIYISVDGGKPFDVVAEWCEIVTKVEDLTAMIPLVGDTVLYDGKETEIEELNSDGTCVIQNPAWDYDEEHQEVTNDREYNVPFFIKVPITEITKKPDEKK